MKKIFAFISLTTLAFSAFAAGDARPVRLQPKTTFSEDARLYREEAYRLQSAGRVDEAYSLYTKALAMDPGYVDLYNDLGIVLEMRGDLDSAEQSYLKAIEIDPAHASSYSNLGFLYEKKRDKERAGFYWRKRYEMGADGDKWKDTAKQHLVELGTWEGLLQEIKEENALKLSKEVAYQREQLRLKKSEEAALHYKIGMDSVARDDYETAVKEFNTVMQLKSEGADVPQMSEKYYKESLANALLHRVKVKLDKSQTLIFEKDCLSLIAELRDSLAIMSDIPADYLMPSKKAEIPVVKERSSQKKIDAQKVVKKDAKK
jgi:Flp pilus assembly protein TadD